jgi:hypothetical protein
MRRDVIETLPASAGTDRHTARKALVRSPRRRLVEGGDVAVLLWMLKPGAAGDRRARILENSPRRDAPGAAAIAWFR